MNTLQAGLRKTFDGPKVHRFVLEAEFSAPPGVTVIFGPSGSGKTTVLQCLAGLVKPDAGTIRVGGEILFDCGRKINLTPQERCIGYVFQDLALFPHMSAAENVGFGIRENGEQKRKRVREILDRFHIAHLAENRPGEISGGERQRVALARALVIHPGLLLLDEPFSALDDELKVSIIDDLKRWIEENKIPVLLVTHDREEAQIMGGRMLLMKEGSVVSQDLHSF